MTPAWHRLDVFNLLNYKVRISADVPVQIALTPSQWKHELNSVIDKYLDKKCHVTVIRWEQNRWINKRPNAFHRYLPTQAVTHPLSTLTSTTDLHSIKSLKKNKEKCPVIIRSRWIAKIHWWIRRKLRHWPSWAFKTWTVWFKSRLNQEVLTF